MQKKNTQKNTLLAVISLLTTLAEEGEEEAVGKARGVDPSRGIPEGLDRSFRGLQDMLAPKLERLDSPITDVDNAVHEQPLSSQLAEKYIGKTCIIRSTASGVWYAKVTAIEPVPGTPLWRADLTEARRIHAWSGAAACSGLALLGPTDGRICAPVEQQLVGDICEVAVTTAEADRAFAKIAAWTAR